MSNGDRVTGEIKELKRGKLRVNTDHMGDLDIEWEDIDDVKSNFAFQFVASDGLRVTGTIGGTNDSGNLVLETDDGQVELGYHDIVEVAQIDHRFWDQLKGSVTFGYSFTKASDVTQSNLGFRVAHRTEARSFRLDGSTIFTRDQASESTQRADLAFTATRFRSNRWFNSYLVGFEQNDELGLDLRSRVGAGIGRFLIQNDDAELGILGGLVGTNEQLQNDVDSENSLEGMAGIEYAHYVYDDPFVDLTSTLTLYPSITQSGRVRGQLDINLRWELISDLFWELTFYDTYDSDPPSGSTSNNDYGVVTSLGYSF